MSKAQLDAIHQRLVLDALLAQSEALTATMSMVMVLYLDKFGLKRGYHESIDLATESQGDLVEMTKKLRKACEDFGWWRWPSNPEGLVKDGGQADGPS